MHVRFSTVLGLPVLDEDTGEVLGRIAGMLIGPDTGAVEGFFVAVRGFFQTQHLFLASRDIRHWGVRVSVRERHALAPLEEHVRLHAMVEEGRPLLGQRMQTEGGEVLGICRDVQFDTTVFQVQWIFPKRFWRWGTACHFSQILEVRRDAIIVKNPSVESREEAVASVPLLPLEPT